ncbi:related to HRD1 - ubiquitin-protein ligase [Ustilago trichophora]|uniref:RING-type E3 ubiquitin transferase n=1 Tax=Ustilago trichophora TaxID=86804 RepID=A0A5C3DQ55_9BASI|nr:related to HRD1 - ubiquitin-protein ligase [Ustilago trichophora]
MPPNNFMSWVTRRRIYAYGAISTLAAMCAVVEAFSERSNFYAAVVHLGRSNGCLLILLNFLLVIALVAGRILQLLYFGQLRRSEVELVCERSWYSLVGTLLAVSIFRDDFSVSFVILFGVLLFLKTFHWLSAERVASIMQSPSVPRIFHIRMVSILTTLFIADLNLVGFSMQMLLVKKVKVGMMVLFTSEFIILTALLLNTIAQYVLNCIDMAREEPWEAKSLYVLYVDLAHDVVRLCTHGYFFILLTRMYGIPLSLIHDLYSAGRSCTTKVKALIRYRQAVKKMETKYPNATLADLQATDGTCIICREDMMAVASEDNAAAAAVVTNVTPKKLGCGHIFHFRCLRSWVERQQSCPTCRRMILDDEPEPTPAAPPMQQPQQRQQQRQQQRAPAQPPNAAGPSAPRGTSQTPTASRSNSHNPTPAEEAYDARLQGFLERLASDLRKVREEGNLSARRASNSRRRVSHSGHSTPRSTVGGVQPNGGVSGGMARQTRNVKFGLAEAFLPPQTHLGNGEGREESGVGGLWMPPPPSTLYPGGRRPQIHSNGSVPHAGGVASHSTKSAEDKGKGKAREESPLPEAASDDENDDKGTVDPVDPREAIRQATLKRFGQLHPTHSTTTTATTTSTVPSSSHLPNEPVPAVGMIPLFDPTSIPDFHTTHLESLPHPLLPSSSAPQTFTAASSGIITGPDQDLDAVLENQKRGVQQQILLLEGIRTRIDGVISDLGRVLDYVESTTPHNVAASSGGQGGDQLTSST